MSKLRQLDDRGRRGFCATALVEALRSGGVAPTLLLSKDRRATLTMSQKERVLKVKGCEHRGGNQYRMVVSAGFKAGGSRNRYKRTVTAKTKKELESLYAEFTTEVIKGLVLNSRNLTLREFVEKQWLLDVETKNLAPKTLHRYKEMLNQRILPELGHLKLSDINRNHIVKLYEVLQTEGSRLDGKDGSLSAQTVLHHHRLLSKILNTAVFWEIISISPMRTVKPPKTKEKIAMFYDEEQLLKLIDTLNSLDSSQFKYKMLTLLGLYTGMRRGELMGLEWKDIDFKNRIITISRTSQYVPRKGIFTKEPKTESSNRTISIPTTIVDLLDEYRKHQDSERNQISDLWVETDRLFTAWNGSPMRPDAISEWFGKFIKMNNLPHITFHGLRHTNVSLLIADGVDIRTIATRLGHTNPTTTLNVYSHMLRKSDQLAADSLEKRILAIQTEVVKDEE